MIRPYVLSLEASRPWLKRNVPSSSSQFSRLRSSLNVFLHPPWLQSDTTYATPFTSSTSCGIIIRGRERCHPCSYTIVMAHRSDSAVVSASKPAGGLMALTGASANVSGCDTRINSEILLRVGACCSIARNICLTNRASDSARCSAVLAIFNLAATCSKLWLGHVGYSPHAMPRVSKIPCSEHAMPNRDPVGYLTVADLQRPRSECYERRESFWPSLATSLPRVHLAVCAQ